MTVSFSSGGNAQHDVRVAINITHGNDGYSRDRIKMTANSEPIPVTLQKICDDPRPILIDAETKRATLKSAALGEEYAGFSGAASAPFRAAEGSISAAAAARRGRTRRERCRAVRGSWARERPC
jgi:hypothetical protein